MNVVERIAELERQVAALRLRETAWVPPHASVGAGSTSDPTVRLYASETTPIDIGEQVRTYRGSGITGPCRIGYRCMINRDAYIRAGVTLGDEVSLGPIVRLITDGMRSVRRTAVPARTAHGPSWSVTARGSVPG